jgi:hypothetical protein
MRTVPTTSAWAARAMKPAAAISTIRIALLLSVGSECFRTVI